MIQTEFVRRGGRVKRFHGFHLLMENTVGHHTFNLIGILLTCAPYTSKELMLAAYYHDLPECITGDIPAPFKRAVPGLRDAMEAEEARLLACYDIQLPHLTDKEQVWLKLADSMDGAFHCLEERRLGNTTLDKIFWTFMGYANTLFTGMDERDVGNFLNLHAHLHTEWEAVGGPYYWDLPAHPHEQGVAP